MQQLRARRRRLLVVVAGLVACVAGWMALYNSDVLRIRQVEVVGARTLDVASVEASAAVPADATMLRSHSAEIERRLMANPWIAKATVKRVLPATLRIEITERVPYALLDTGTVFWSIDEEGRVLGLATVETTSASTLVMIRDVPAFQPMPGEVASSKELANALEVLKGIDPGLRDRVRGVSAPSVEETVLITEGSIEIMIGEATRLAEKSALVKGILEAQGDKVVFIDVRSVERPVSRGLGQ
jgi:cell division protein FtsQ